MIERAIGLMLTKIRHRIYPFEHGICNHALPSDFLPRLMEFVFCSARWKRMKCGIGEFSSLEPTKIDFKQIDYLTNLKLALPPKFLPSPGSFDIFRFESGEGLGLHDDAGTDVYRLTIPISRTRALSEGGALILMGNNTEDVLVYPAAHNDGVLFRTLPGHEHAISVVSGEPLYLLVLEFGKRMRATMAPEDRPR